MNRGDKQERVISTMGILKGRYFAMTAFNWSHDFWIEYNMGFLLSSSKCWLHSVNPGRVIVTKMACVAWMSEQKFWIPNSNLTCTQHGFTLIAFLTIRACKRWSVAKLTEQGCLTQLFWIQNGVSRSWKTVRVLDFNWERAPQAYCQSSQ